MNENIAFIINFNSFSTPPPPKKKQTNKQQQQQQQTNKSRTLKNIHVPLYTCK